MFVIPSGNKFQISGGLHSNVINNLHTDSLKCDALFRIKTGASGLVDPRDIFWLLNEVMYRERHSVTLSLKYIYYAISSSLFWFSFNHHHHQFAWVINGSRDVTTAIEELSNGT